MSWTAAIRTLSTKVATDTPHATTGHKHFCNIFSLFLTVDAPKITQPHESQSVATGTSAAFTVKATGDDLQFQWQKDGKDIDESRLQWSQTDNPNTLHIEHVKKSDQGHYRCLVKNQVKETSHEAELTVCELFFVCCRSFIISFFGWSGFDTQYIHIAHAISPMWPTYTPTTTGHNWKRTGSIFFFVLLMLVLLATGVWWLVSVGKLHHYFSSECMNVCGIPTYYAQCRYTCVHACLGPCILPFLCCKFCIYLGKCNFQFCVM